MSDEDVTSQASQLSIEDWDCHGAGNPTLQCHDHKNVAGDVDGDQAREALSDVSLRSCHSTDALKQWTMCYPVTACCKPTVCPRRSRRRRRRRRRPRRLSGGDDESSATDTDVKLTYTDCSGNVCCRKTCCCPRKPCSSVPTRLLQ